MTDRRLALEALFSSGARWTERQAGRSHTLALAVAIVVVWAATGRYFAWSNSWLLVISTGTNIVTFLMVFLIQHSQSRDTQAIQLKLDELIRVNRQARNELLQLEHLSEKELVAIRSSFDTVIASRDGAKTGSTPDRAPAMSASATPASVKPD